MQRITGIYIFLLSLLFSVNGYAECFEYNGDLVSVVRESKISVSLEVIGKEQMSGLFFCIEKGNALLCQGDDDSGAFILDKKSISFKTKVGLGNSDEPYFIKLKDTQKELQKSCSK